MFWEAPGLKNPSSKVLPSDIKLWVTDRDWPTERVSLPLEKQVLVLKIHSNRDRKKLHFVISCILSNFWHYRYKITVLIKPINKYLCDKILYWSIDYHPNEVTKYENNLILLLYAALTIFLLWRLGVTLSSSFNEIYLLPSS
jgi:hypothetical protein